MIKMAADLLLCIGTILILSGVSGDTVCPRGWIANDGTCYLFAHYLMQHNEAMSYCSQHDSHLIEVTDSGENAFIKTHLRQLNTKHWWIGMTDEMTEGIWMWTNSNSLVNYTDWYKTQPTGDKEDCAYFAYNTDFQWGDTTCVSANIAPICEKIGTSCDAIAEIIG